MNRLYRATVNLPRKCSAHSGRGAYVNRQRTRFASSRRRRYGCPRGVNHRKAENIRGGTRPSNRDDPLVGVSLPAIRL